MHEWIVLLLLIVSISIAVRVGMTLDRNPERAIAIARSIRKVDMGYDTMAGGKYKEWRSKEYEATAKYQARHRKEFEIIARCLECDPHRRETEMKVAHELYWGAMDDPPHRLEGEYCPFCGLDKTNTFAEADELGNCLIYCLDCGGVAHWQGL